MTLSFMLIKGKGISKLINNKKSAIKSKNKMQKN